MKQALLKIKIKVLNKKKRTDDGITFHQDSYQSYFEFVEPIHQEAQ